MSKEHFGKSICYAAKSILYGFLTSESSILRVFCLPYSSTPHSLAPYSNKLTVNNIIFCEVQVLEETGFDVSKFLKKDEYIEMIFGQQRVRLYIVAGVKEGTLFAPLTKKEISVCRFPLGIM